MNSETLQKFKLHALQEYPKEACGLVIIFRGRERYIPCENKAITPSEHFILSREEYADAEDMGEIIAICHSHPDHNAIPSQGDLVACEASGLKWYIASVLKDKGELSIADIQTVEPHGYEAPLVGRTFAHGVLDCYGLIRDWYKRERGMDLPDFERQDKWWERGGNLYEENFEKAGFEKVNPPLQIGDVIYMQYMSPVVNHAAVYVGDGQILQHLYGRLSSRDIYGGVYREMTRAVVRPKEQK